MTWIVDHLDDIGSYTLQHSWLAGLPLLIGLLVAIPLGWLARRWSWAYTPVVVGTGLLYTIPSLALFILMPLILGTRILDPVNVVVAMTIYTVALLTRTVAELPEHRGTVKVAWCGPKSLTAASLECPPEVNRTCGRVRPSEMSSPITVTVSPVAAR